MLRDVSFAIFVRSSNIRPFSLKFSIFAVTKIMAKFIGSQIMRQIKGDGVSSIVSGV
jgi:hypothetical protein